MSSRVRSVRFEDVVLAPFRLLERTRGWKRRALVLSYLVCGFIGLGGCWWLGSLSGLPDIGEPFDVATYRTQRLAPEDDAFTMYREAVALLVEGPIETSFGRLRRGKYQAGWEQAGQEVRDWVARNRPALAVWRRGTERDDAIAIRFDQWRLDGGQRPLARMVDFLSLAVLEAARHEEADQPAEAWEWYRAALRASRHVGMHGSSSSRFLGSVIVSSVSDCLNRRWLEHTALDTRLRRRAIEDLQAIVAMTPPHSEAIKGDYLEVMDKLDRPTSWLGPQATELFDHEQYPMLFQVLLKIKREPERSRRVFNIIFAHWLASVDKPPRQRPRMVETRQLDNQTHPDFPYYAEPGQRDPAHPLSSEQLYRWYQSTVIGRGLSPPLYHRVNGMDRERALLANLIVGLAEDVYLAEQGRPAQSVQDLVGTVLSELPEGHFAEGESSLPGRLQRGPGAAGRDQERRSGSRRTWPPKSD